MLNFDGFFDVSLNKWLNKKNLIHQWFEMPWHLCQGTLMYAGYLVMGNKYTERKMDG